MYCKHCGAQIDDRASVCVHCGIATGGSAEKDSASAGWWWLGFLIPLAGLLVWLFCKDSTPIRAKKAGKGALTSVIVSIVCSVVFTVVYIVLITQFMLAY